jgi:glycerate kinase
VVRVLVAPQEFKGSLSAGEAADAIATGIRRARPEWQLDVLPLSDGGPGFIDALRRAVRADTCSLVVHDALGRPLLGRYVILREGRVAVVEAAQANGLIHVDPTDRDPLRADSGGVGELIADAAAAKPNGLIVGVGGSATTDGGAGMARVLGARFLDAGGRELPPGGGPLVRLARIDWSRPAVIEGLEPVVATDVTNPLIGSNGAAAVYAPQKGATPEQVELLETGLRRYAEVVRRDLGVDVAELPGAGAAGGLAAGLVAFLGARIASGFDVVAEATRLVARLAAADLVVTGEGSFDNQSLQGKTTGRVIELARAAGKPAIILAGRADGPAPNVHTLMDLEPDPTACMAHASQILAELGSRWAASTSYHPSEP